MDRWDAEPFWEFWQTQMALMASETAPDPALRREAEMLVRELTGHTRQASGQTLGALRHGAKHWKRRR
jgi:hypothetical protein